MPGRLKHLESAIFIAAFDGQRETASGAVPAYKDCGALHMEKTNREERRDYFTIRGVLTFHNSSTAKIRGHSSSRKTTASIRAAWLDTYENTETTPPQRPLHTPNAPDNSSSKMASAFSKPDAGTDDGANAARMAASAARMVVNVTKGARDAQLLIEKIFLASEAIGHELLLLIDNINARLAFIVCSQILIFVLLICMMFKLRKLTSMCKESVQGNKAKVARQH